VKKVIVACFVIAATCTCFARENGKSARQPDAAPVRSGAVGWILNRIDSKGFMIASYVPALDKTHGAEADYSLQPMTLWALCGARSENKSVARLHKLISADMKPVKGIKGAIAPTYKERVDTIDAALFLLALHEARKAGRGAFKNEINGLNNYLLKAFAPAGEFVTAWPYGTGDADLMQNRLTQGLALYALAVSYSNDRSRKEFEAVFTVAHLYWKRVLRNLPLRTGAPWLMAAFGTVAQMKDDDEYDNIVFDVADYLVGLQLFTQNARFIEYRGGFPVFSSRGKLLAAPTIEAAGFTYGLTFAWRLALKRGDKSRARKYLGSILAAYAFFRPLQYNEKNISHFRKETQSKLLGAFRVGPENCRIESWSVCKAVLALREIEKVQRTFVEKK